MLRFECDSCHRLKEAGENWVLSFAAETIGVTVARREIGIASAWDDARAINSLAVHFCSDECRRAYVDQLFGDQPATAEVISEEEVEVEVLPTAATTEKRIVRTVPGAEGETTIRKTGTTKRVKRVKRTRRKAS